MVQEDVKKEMARSFERDFATMLRITTYERAATDGVFDRVTETYTGGTNGFQKTLQALWRKPKGSIVDGINVHRSDKKITFLQDVDPTLTPQLNDVIDGVWRIVEFESDPADVFWTVYVRKVS